MFLLKQVQPIIAGKQNGAQTIEVPGAYSYTSGKAYGNLVLQATLPVAKRPQCMASTFLGKCFHYSKRYTPAEEVGFLDIFVNLM